MLVRSEIVVGAVLETLVRRTFFSSTHEDYALQTKDVANTFLLLSAAVGLSLYNARPWQTEEDQEEEGG
jgi:hypothetical protein